MILHQNNGDKMKSHIIKIHLVKYGTRLAFLRLEDVNIHILADWIKRGYTIEVESTLI